MKNNHWHKYPTIKLPAPVLSLAAGSGILWAGGTGGIARYSDGWQSLNAGFPLSLASTLCFSSGWLFAGSTEGIARSNNGGNTWQMCTSNDKVFPVGAIVSSPSFGTNATLLCATLGGGVLRSEDIGQTWKPVNSGLENLEVLSVSWREDDTVLAATADGIYRSTNGGLAWTISEGTQSFEVNSVFFLRDDRAFALLDNGNVLFSENSGISWQPFTSFQLPGGASPNSLLITADDTWLVGTADQGTHCSADKGISWTRLDSEPALSFTTSDNKVFAGLSDGVMVIENEQAARLPPPPLHDLRYLLVYNRRPLVAGLLSGILRWNEHDAWETMPAPVSMVTALVETPDGALIISGPEGIQRSTDKGNTWQVCLEGDAGCVAHISFRSDGYGWAGNADGTRFLGSHDYGKSWETLYPPFLSVPLVALQAADKVVFAAIYKPQKQIAQLWYSSDGGQGWRASAIIHTDWPIVTTQDNPALISFGGLAFVWQPDGKWYHYNVGDGKRGVRLLDGNGEILYALTNIALLRSEDQGENWITPTYQPPLDQVNDLAMGRKKLFLLLTEGRVWAYPL